jgi:ABC-type nitrate/sulfonate/bicarbonate transport system substrate-binding protein
MDILWWILMLCVIFVSAKNIYAQGKKNNNEKLSVEDSNNKRTSEKEKPVKVSGKLRVAYIPATHDALLFIAKEENFFEFEDYELDVQIREYPNSPEALVALERGGFDIAIPGIAAPLYGIAAGKTLKIIGGEAWYSAGIVARPALKPKDGARGKELLEPFKGKRIASIKNSTGDAILRGKIREDKLASEIKIRTYPTPQKAMHDLINGKVDAAMLWSPHMSTMEEEHKQFKVVLWTRQLLDHPCCRQVTTMETYNNKRKALVYYMAGIIRAKDFMAKAAEDEDKRKAVLKDVKKYVKNEEKILIQELFTIDTKLEKKRTEVSPNNSPNEIEAYAKMMIAATLISPKSLSIISKSVDTDILTEAYQIIYPKMTKKDAEGCAKSGLLSDKEIQDLWNKYGKQPDSNQ